MPEPSHFHANLQRGALLLNQNRPNEALPFLQAAIAANPDAPQGYAELARCWNEIPSQRWKAIGAIDRAIALAPNASFYCGCKGWYLVCQGKHRGALAAAQKGMSLNPQCLMSLNAEANAYTKLRRWKAAEATCRRILSLNPNDPPGLNLLAQALRHLGCWKESREVVAQILAGTPNNAFGQANAGFAALLAGDHLRANEHFRESLRMNPQFDLARRGLLQSLGARNWMVRTHLRLASWMRRPVRGWGCVAVFVGALLLFTVPVYLTAMKAHQWARIVGRALGIAFVGFILFMYVSRAITILVHFLLIFDPVGRHALTKREKVRAVLPMVIFVVIVGCLIAGHQVGIAVILIAIMGGLLLSIQAPLLLDRWEQRRIDKSAKEARLE